MKIQCLIRRSGGSEVTFDACDRWPAGTYRFKPESDAADAPHVAEVTEERHIHRLLSMPDVYRMVVEGAPQPQAPESGEISVPPKLPEGAGDAPPPAPSEPDAPSDAAPELEPAVAERVAALRNLTIKELKAKINTYSYNELRAALAAEQARTDDAPRKGWIDVVVAHLGIAQ